MDSESPSNIQCADILCRKSLKTEAATNSRGGGKLEEAWPRMARTNKAAAAVGVCASAGL